MNLSQKVFCQDFDCGMGIMLKIIDVPLIEPASYDCDNNGVVKNMSTPESSLSKKHYSCNYNVVRESGSEGIMRASKNDTLTNLTDLLVRISLSP